MKSTTFSNKEIYIRSFGTFLVWYAVFVIARPFIVNEFFIPRFTVTNFVLGLKGALWVGLGGVICAMPLSGRRLAALTFCVGCAAFDLFIRLAAMGGSIEARTLLISIVVTLASAAISLPSGWLLLKQLEVRNQTDDKFGRPLY